MTQTVEEEAFYYIDTSLNALKPRTTTMNEPLFDIDVALIGTDGNAFALMGKVTTALKRAGFGDAVKPFRDEAMSGDYNHLVATCAKYVNIV